MVWSQKFSKSQFSLDTGSSRVAANLEHLIALQQLVHSALYILVSILEKPSFTSAEVVVTSDPKHVLCDYRSISLLRHSAWITRAAEYFFRLIFCNFAIDFKKILPLLFIFVLKLWILWKDELYLYICLRKWRAWVTSTVAYHLHSFLRLLMFYWYC